jgi:hypothetical protein
MVPETFPLINWLGLTVLPREMARFWKTDFLLFFVYSSVFSVALL